MPTPTDDNDLLESLVDRHGLPGVLELLAEVCGERAEHVRRTWGDRPLANVWSIRRARLAALAPKYRASFD